MAAAGVHSISGDLTANLKSPTPGDQIHVPDPSVQHDIFKSFAAGGFPSVGHYDVPPNGRAAADWYVNGLNNVTPNPTWPNAEECVWEFEYNRSGMGHGDAPDPGREFYSTTLTAILSAKSPPSWGREVGGPAQPDRVQWQA